MKLIETLALRFTVKQICAKAVTAGNLCRCQFSLLLLSHMNSSEILQVAGFSEEVGRFEVKFLSPLTGLE